MKTVKLLAFALLITSVSFAQTKTKRSKAAKAVTVAPVAAPAAPAVVATPAAAQAPQTPSQLKWEKETHEFGTIEQGKPVSYEFTFTNTTSKDVTLTNVKASCGCTATNYTKTAVKPGEKGIVTATYNAAAGGAFHKTVTVMTSEENSAPKFITIKGTVKVNEVPAVVAPVSK
jgi:guanyl-specific ribonuclease Sa